MVAPAWQWFQLAARVPHRTMTMMGQRQGALRGLGRAGVDFVVQRQALRCCNMRSVLHKASSRLDWMAGSGPWPATAPRGQQTRRQRPRYKHRPVAARQQQRTTQVLFHHRPQDEAQQQGCRFAAEFDEQVADEAEQAHQPDVEGGVVGGVRPTAQTARWTGNSQRYGTDRAV